MKEYTFLDSNDGFSKDTADTLSVVSLTISTNEDVTISTPGSTPRVLDDESFIEAELLVTDSQDSVVKISTAVLGDDTGLVELEDTLVSLKGNGDGGVDEGSLQLIGGVLSDELVVGGNIESLSLLVLALAILSSVGIVRFDFETVLGSIFNSEIRPATVATFVFSGVTINDLLFREGEELAVVDEVETFNNTGSGESPA